MVAAGGHYFSLLPARPKTAVFREAQKYVRARLEKKWIAAFIQTPDYLARNGLATGEAATEKGHRVSMFVIGAPPWIEGGPEYRKNIDLASCLKLIKNGGVLPMFLHGGESKVRNGVIPCIT